MVTGDIKNTATAIAKTAGILDKNYDPDDALWKYTVMEGK